MMPESLPDMNTLRSMLATQKMGLSVMGSELKWVAIKSLRNWEICQLRKRLKEEYALLGRVTADEVQDQREAELSRRQISFLQEEIAHLEQEVVRARQEFVRNRVRSS